MLSLLGSVILIYFLYVLFHELGHAIVAVACGAKITGFSIIKAHMSYSGGVFNQITKSLFHVAGMLLPVLLCFLFTLTFNGSRKNMLYMCFSIMSFVVTTSSILAWIIVSFVSMFPTPPSGDDVAKFLISSQWNPFVVIVSAIFLITVMVIIASYKGVLKSFLDLRNKILMQKNNPFV